MKARQPLDIQSIVGHITSPYGPRELPGIPGDFHSGLDLGKKPKGSPVYSVDEGIVDIADSAGRSTAGQYVSIRHANYQTRYLHLNSVSVKAGQPVAAGQMIGTLGATGQVTGPHLHIDIIIDGHHVDPEPFLRGITLLPSVVPIVLDGEEILTGRLTVHDPGTTYVEGRRIRDLAEDLSCDVEWVDETRSIHLHPRGTKTIRQAINLLSSIVERR